MVKKEFPYYKIDEENDNEEVKNLKSELNLLLDLFNRSLFAFGEFFDKVEEYNKNKRKPKLQKMIDDFGKNYRTYFKDMSQELAKLRKESN